LTKGISDAISINGSLAMHSIAATQHVHEKSQRLGNMIINIVFLCKDTQKWRATHCAKMHVFLYSQALILCMQSKW